MKIKSTLLIQLKALVKHLFTKPSRNRTQQVNLNIKESNTVGTKKYFCYFSEKQRPSSLQNLTMKNEEITLANVTKLNTQSTKSKAKLTTLPMQVETVIIPLFDHKPIKKSQHKKHGVTY